MEDKVISEFKVVETEDGYRIEIKGDKEKLKHLFENGPMGFAGPGRHFFGRHGFGPFGHHGHHRRWGGPWGWGEEDQQPGPGPAADAPRA